MTIYILLIDGSCFKTEAKSLFQGLELIWTKHFSNSEFEDFVGDVNLVEWKDQKNRYIKNYKNKKNPIETFALDTDFKLENYLKVKPSKKPVKELEEEFDYE